MPGANVKPFVRLIVTIPELHIQMIIDLHVLGGDVIIAKSEVGHGSTFIASLPLRFIPAATPVSIAVAAF